MVKLNYCLIKQNHISEILYSISHRRNVPIIGLCAGDRMKNFYTFVNTNASYRNINLMTFSQYQNQQSHIGATIIIMNPTITFQQLEKILIKSQSLSQNCILVLLQENKKYINIVSKKIENLQTEQMTYSVNKFVGINDKIREFVDQNYDMNRAAFYAYGEYINIYRANLLKKIFRTEMINVDNLAKSFGFTSAQRVKDGTFLKQAAKKQLVASKKAQKRKKKKQQKLNGTTTEQIQERVEQPIKKTKKIEKVLKTKVKKSLIAKQ